MGIHGDIVGQAGVYSTLSLQMFRQLGGECSVEPELSGNVITIQVKEHCGSNGHGTLGIDVEGGAK